MQTIFTVFGIMVIFILFNRFLLGPVDLSEGDQIIKSVPSKEIKEIIKNKPGIKIIDVRTDYEFESGTIDNAINMDCGSIKFNSQLEKLDKSNAYIIFCASGSRSRNCLKLMKELKFMEVYDLAGGISKFN